MMQCVAVCLFECSTVSLARRDDHNKDACVRCVAVCCGVLRCVAVC